MSDWHEVSLSQLGEVNRGRSRHRPRYAEHLYGGPYPFIQTGDVKASRGRISTFSQTYSEDGLAQSRLWPAGTMCITIAANIAETSVLDFPACFPDSIVGFIPDAKKADVRFVEYVFRTLRADLQHQASGSVQDNINLETLARLKFSVPALSEQQAIAEVLGALDDKIAANTKRATTSSELAGLVYDSSATRFGTRPMSEVLTPVLGGTPPRSRAEFWDGDKLWASAKDITGARFGVVLSTDEKITDAAVAGTKAKPLPAGSVILTARGTVGAVARLGAPASFNQSCYGFVPGYIPPGVLYFAITRAVLRAKEIAHGSVFDTIAMKTFDHLPFPDFDAEALTSTESEIGPLLEVVATVVRENNSLATMRDALLPLLMSSKLRVKDAESLVSAAV